MLGIQPGDDVAPACRAGGSATVGTGFTHVVLQLQKLPQHARPR